MILYYFFLKKVKEKKGKYERFKILWFRFMFFVGKNKIK